MKQITDNAWILPLGNSNTVLLQDGGELTLVDAGFPKKEKMVFDAIASLGRKPSDLKHLVFTHSHPDHIGSAAAIVKATGARTYMHALDAPLAESGGPFREMTPGNEIIPRLVFHLLRNPKERVASFKIDQLVADGDTLPVAGGLRAIHVPGQDAGQLATSRRATVC